LQTSAELDSSTILIFKIEIDKGSSTLFEIEIEADKFINFDVMLSPKPSSREPPNLS
jgi:hypothetical protein